MSEEEALAFLDEQRVVVCATNGHDGFPHLMPLWYVVRDGRLWAWTYAKSQKVRNVERDPRATLQVEQGVEYQELRGIMLRTEVTLHREVDDVTALGIEIFRRSTGGQARWPRVRRGGCARDVGPPQARSRRLLTEGGVR